MLPLKKEFYRIWFEFYKISINSPDPVVLKNLKKSDDLYSPWGDVEKITFNQWWDSHKHLFQENSVSVIESSYDRKFQDTLLLEVPINQSTTVLMKQIR